MSRIVDCELKNALVYINVSMCVIVDNFKKKYHYKMHY